MSRGAMYAKMGGVFVTCCVGGPLLMYWVTPAEGELFKRFSPELQKHNLESRDRRTKEYEDFAAKMKEYSKSDKPIWAAAAEAQEKARQDILQRQSLDRQELLQKQNQEKASAAQMQEEMRAQIQRGR